MGLFHKQLPHSKSKPFPRESDRLLNPYKRTVLPQISKALGHERVQFTLVGLFSRFTSAANFSRAYPGAKRRKNFLLQKQLPSSKPKPFPKKIRSQISKALGHERFQFTLVGLFAGFANAANFSRADPGANRGKKSLLQKQLPSSKPKPFPKEQDCVSNPYSRTVFPQITNALGHERVQFTLVGLCSGFTIAANFSRADPGAKRRKKSLLQKQLPSSKPKPFPKESDRLLNPY